jgi:CheY-like chemotaxis protein
MLGYNVELVESAEHALEALIPNKFDILMTDINMPGMDGYELTIKIRNSDNSAIANIPIIAITANVTTEDEEKCRASGIDGFIAKPVDIEYLETFLENLAQNDEKIQCRPLGTSVSQPLAGNTNKISVFDSELLDTSDLVRFVGGNREMVAKLLATFLEQTPVIVEDIKTACSGPDFDALINACHKLKSSARSVGAFRLSDLCIAMETAGKTRQLDTLQKLGAQVESIFKDTRSAMNKITE